MEKILVIGATGFVGKHLVQALVQSGHMVRCLARNPDQFRNMSGTACEVVKGDISDAESIRKALELVEAAYICINTLSAQQNTTKNLGFMDIEMNGLRNIVEGCRANGVKRLIYLTSLGISPESTNTWTRERWKAEQMLLQSGLNVTVLRPGQIVGRGGFGFDAMVGQARRRLALGLGNGKQLWRNIALDDLLYYLMGVLDDSRTYGQCYEVGCDDILSFNQMIDVAADVLNTPHPWKVSLPQGLILMIAPLIERGGRLPKGAIGGLFDGTGIDMVGTPGPIRNILPKALMSYRQAVETALAPEVQHASS